MPCHCEGLIKAIDAYLAKEDDELELALEAAGYVDAPETIEHITSLEDGIAVVLISETDYTFRRRRTSLTTRSAI